MIASDGILKLALKEKASWDVYQIAMFDTATIKVPTNGFLLMTQIIWNHFVDLDGTEAVDDAGALMAKNIHSISFLEQGAKSELNYNFRSGATLGLQGTGAGAKAYAMITTPITVIETFKIFVKDVNVDISRWQDMKDFTTGAGKMAEDSEERPIPLGFGVAGTGINVTGQITFPAPDLGKYYPNGDSRKILGIAAPGGANYRDRARNPVNANTRLKVAPGNTLLNRQNMPPFVGIGCWKFSGKPEEIANLL